MPNCVFAIKDILLLQNISFPCALLFPWVFAGHTLCIQIIQLWMILPQSSEATFKHAGRTWKQRTAMLCFFLQVAKQEVIKSKSNVSSRTLLNLATNPCNRRAVASIMASLTQNRQDFLRWLQLTTFFIILPSVLKVSILPRLPVIEGNCPWDNSHPCEATGSQFDLNSGSEFARLLL